MFFEKSRLVEAELSLGNLGVAEHGALLWEEACDRVQSGELDDRPLYWRRLTLPEEPAHWSASRNYHPTYRKEADLRILVTGFDPFNLDVRIDQSNPSGVVALALDKTCLDVRGSTAEIRSLIVPVSFADFDGGLVESLVDPLLNDLDLLVTVSMGREEIDLERFPGLRRSSGKPDNKRMLCGGTAADPLIPPGLSGPEFVEFSLPVEKMREVPGKFEIRDNHTVTTLERGEVSVDTLSELAGQIAVQGSGGGYLSNEIAYRVVRSVGGRFPVGHIHTPRVEGIEPTKIRDITDQVTKMIKAAIHTLPGRR